MGIISSSVMMTLTMELVGPSPASFSQLPRGQRPDGNYQFSVVDSPEYPQVGRTETKFAEPHVPLSLSPFPPN